MPARASRATCFSCSIEYVSHELMGLIDMAYKFTEVQVKYVALQLLHVLAYIHFKNYDLNIKTSNVFISSDFKVKIADFRLARCLSPPIFDRVGDFD